MRRLLVSLALAVVSAVPASAQILPDGPADAARVQALAPQVNATARAERLIAASRVPARGLGTAAPTRSALASGPLLETSYHDTYDLLTRTWAPGSRTDYTYTSGRITRVIDRSWLNGAWSNSTRTETTYDGDRPLTSRSDMWSGSAWVPAQLETYTYTGTTGQLVTSSLWENGDWQAYERTRYTLSGDFVVSAQRDTLRSGTWTPLDRFTVAEEGGAVVQTNGVHTGTAWEATDRTVYQNQTLASLYAAFRAMEATLLVGGTFSFVLPDHRDDVWNGSAWLPVSRQTTTRTGTGRPETVTFSDWDGLAWEEGSRHVFLYGSDGLPVGVSVELPGESGWATVFSEDYTHENGLLVESVLALWFGPMADPTPTSRMRHVYANATDAPAPERPVATAALGHAAPNPFTAATRLSYTLDAPGEATLGLYDLTGRLVATLASGPHASGRHDAVVDGAGLPAGAYLVRLVAGGGQQTRLLTLVR